MDSSCKIFVGNVPFDCTNEEFKEIFKNVEGCTLAELVNRNSNSNTRGFGFLTFINSDYASNFLELKNKIILKDRILRFTKYYDTNGGDFITKNLKNKNILVNNIPKHFDNNKLKEFFSSYGNISLCYINKDINTKKKINTAVVEFLDDDSYQKVLSMKNFTLNDGTVINVKKYQEEKQEDKTNNDYDIKEIYKIAFNAGRKYGRMENYSNNIKN